MPTFYSTINIIQRSSKSYGKLSCLSLTKIISENKDLCKLKIKYDKEFAEYKKKIDYFE